MADSAANLLAAYGLTGMVAMSSLLGSAGLAPYTDEDEATTTCGRPWRRAASSTSMVPVALVWWLAIGSASDRGTEGRAARWTTASASVEHIVE